jgi:hypothetical protein
MAGHSRSQNGVASLAYVPAIPIVLVSSARLSEMPGTGPGMTNTVSFSRRVCAPELWEATVTHSLTRHHRT